MDAWITAIATTITAGIAIYVVIDRKKQKEEKERKRQKRDAILIEIAKMREEGVAIRNLGCSQDLEGAAFNDWETRMVGIDDAIVAKVKELDPIEGEFLDTRGEIPLDILPIECRGRKGRQLQTLINATFTMIRAKEIADKHHTPRNYD